MASRIAVRGTTLPTLYRTDPNGHLPPNTWYVGGKIHVAGGLSGTGWAPQSPLILGRDMRARAIGFQKELPRCIDSVWLPYKVQYTHSVVSTKLSTDLTHIDCR